MVKTIPAFFHNTPLHIIDIQPGKGDIKTPYDLIVRQSFSTLFTS